MNHSKTRFILTLAALAIIALVGYLWWQQNRHAFSGRPIVSFVDRGLEDDLKQRFLDDIQAKKQEFDEKNSQGQRDISLLLQLGNLHYQLGELAKSVSYYDQILSTNPADAPAWENKGQSLLEMGDFEGAEKAWFKALESHQYELTYLRLADLYREKMPERQAEIQELMETAIANLGQQPPLLIALGHWYRDNGYLEEAISHYQIALALAPGNKDMEREISLLRARLSKDLEESINR